MGAHHFFVRPEEVENGRVQLTGSEARHAARVLRVRPGERISVSDGRGRVLSSVVTSVGDTVDAVVEDEHAARPPAPSIVLYQAVAKGEAMDVAVQKAVEMGVTQIVPFVAERSIVRWDEAKREKAHKRLTEVARSASKQSRSPWLAEVRPVAGGVDGAVGGPRPLLVLYEGADRRLRAALPERAPAAVGVLVGPEGGLTPREVERLEEAGGEIVTLGERILRTETAGPVAAALIGYAYGDLG